MIKKYLLGFVVLFGGLFSFCFGYSEIRVLLTGFVGETTFITDNTSDLALDLDINGNFNTFEVGDNTITKNLIKYKPSGDRGTVVYWDSNNTLNSFSVGRGNVYDNYQASGFCITDKGNETGDCYNHISGKYTYTYEDIQEFAGTITEFKYYATVESSNNFPQQAFPFMPCWSNETKSFCASFSNYSNANCKNNGTCKDSNNTIQTSYLDFDTFPDSILGESPLHGGGGGDIPDIIGSGSTVLTNSAVALGLSYRYGYSIEDCYGGYPLNDIFTADLDPANFTGFLYGSGASIYDIFNAYSGSYFTDINTFYNSFYSRYSIGNISSFWDYPKGLYNISQRAGLLGSIYDLYPVNMANLVEYCDLKLKSDPDALYTGDNYIGIEGYYSLIGEVYDKRRYYDTNLFSGSDSTGSMSIDEFFTSVSNRLVAGLEDISDNRTGIIPSYILMVMMALILFRLISH